MIGDINVYQSPPWARFRVHSKPNYICVEKWLHFCKHAEYSIMYCRKPNKDEKETYSQFIYYMRHKHVIWPSANQWNEMRHSLRTYLSIGLGHNLLYICGWGKWSGTPHAIRYFISFKLYFCYLNRWRYIVYSIVKEHLGIM